MNDQITQEVFRFFSKYLLTFWATCDKMYLEKHLIRDASKFLELVLIGFVRRFSS